MIKRILAVALVSMIMAMPCEAAKKEPKTTTRTLKSSSYTQPGADLVTKGKNKSGYFRAWAVGESTSEPMARAKAIAYASADLSEMIEKAVLSSTDIVFVEVEGSAGSAAESKSLMKRSVSTISSQVLEGAVPIFDEWGDRRDGETYRSYIVLELRGQDVVDALYNAYVEESKKDKKAKKVDKELLDREFLKAVDQLQ